MTTTTHHLQLTETDCALFYAIGQRIREREQLPLTAPEEQNILTFATQQGVSLQLITAHRENLSGRIAAFVYHDQAEQGFIGWYACDKDDELSNELLRQSEKWLLEKGCRRITGPVNGTTWNPYRFNMTSEQPLFIAEPYQPLHYLSAWQKAGFSESHHYYTDQPPRTRVQPMTLSEVEQILGQQDLRIGFFTRDLAEEMKYDLYGFYNLCFSGNPFFRKIPMAAYLDIYEKGLQILDSGHSIIVRDNNNGPVAVVLSYQDVCHRLFREGKLSHPDYQKHRLIIKTIATHPDYRNRQLGTLVINLIHNLAYRNGFDEVIHALMYSDNISAKKGREKFSTEIIREYCLLTKEL